MPITDLVAPEAILPALKVNSKKQALQELAAKAAELTGQNERSVFEVLLQREKLGTTAVGYGVAIPHGKLPKLEKIFGLFARLDRPIDFRSMDGQPVDLVFLLLAPKAPAPITSKRSPASPACCATRTSPRSSAPRAMPRRFIRCSRCRRRRRLKAPARSNPPRAFCDLFSRSGAVDQDSARVRQGFGAGIFNT